MNKLLGSYLRRFYVFFFWLSVMLSTSVLFAAKEEPKKEPIWVMSWATFIFFIAIMIFFLAHSTLRPNTALTNTEQKEIESEKAEEAEAKKKAAGVSRIKPKVESRIKH